MGLTAVEEDRAAQLPDYPSTHTELLNSSFYSLFTNFPYRLSHEPTKYNVKKLQP